jgi:hypothetical protein
MKALRADDCHSVIDAQRGDSSFVIRHSSFVIRHARSASFVMRTFSRA